MFGINKETRGTAILPIPAAVKLPAVTAQWKTGYEFPIVRLLNVSFIENKEITRGGVSETTSVLQFFFKDGKDRQFTHLEFPLDPSVNKYEEKVEWLNQRIKHLWDETIGEQHMPENGIGTGAKTFAEYFKAVAEAFKSVTYTKGEGESAKTLPLYPSVLLYLKLTYNQDRLQLPMFPNFVQRAVGLDNSKLPCEGLLINPEYDAIEPKARQKAAPTTGYTNTGTNAGFGDVDTSDFPDV